VHSGTEKDVGFLPAFVLCRHLPFLLRKRARNRRWTSPSCPSTSSRSRSHTTYTQSQSIQLAATYSLNSLSHSTQPSHHINLSPWYFPSLIILW
jgi:hypothetical protein